MNFNNILFRCSELSNLTTNPQGKEARERGDLSKTTTSYLKEVFIREKFGREKMWDTKETTKGKLKEEDSIDLVSTLFPNKLLLKNKERRSNDFITGECDLVFEVTPGKRIVIDVKTSWDIFTFSGADMVKAYHDQLQGYMWLWDADSAVLAYCLVDTPEHQITDELYRKGFSYDPDEYTDNVKYDIAKNMIVTRDFFEVMRSAHFPEAANSSFIEVPAEDRIKTFKVERDPNFEQLITDRVVKCREILNEMTL